MITNAGGFAVLSSDYPERYGIELVDLPPEIIEEMNGFLPDFRDRGNPIDLLGGDPCSGAATSCASTRSRPSRCSTSPSG